MRILAIESSSMTASAAIMTDDVLTAEFTTNYKQTHSQTLLPMIDDMCKITQIPIETIDLIAVSSGPGSYTGLRIGSATGKGIGLALDKPVVSVPTLEAMALNVIGTDRLVCPIMDARRGNVYTGIFGFEYDKCGMTGGLITFLSVSLMSMEELADKINETGMPVMFLGDAVMTCRGMIAEKIQNSYIFAPANMSMPRASSVAVRGAQLAAKGFAADAREHVPDYLGPSQAERKYTGKSEV